MTATLSPDVQQQTVDRFYRDGFALVPGFLSSDECADLRERTDRIAALPECAPRANDYEFVVRDPLSFDPVFANLFVREPILGLVRAILGRECRFCGQNVIRNRRGQAVHRWHVDDCDRLEYPLPPDVPRWDARVRLPVLWLSVQVALSDIETMEHGPTQIVPGSHYSGRLCPTQDDPTFEGQGPAPVFCHAGDAYLFNHQTWHRGSPNTSDRTRYLMQLQYAVGDSRAVRMQGMEMTPRRQAILARAEPGARDFLQAAARYCV